MGRKSLIGSVLDRATAQAAETAVREAISSLPATVTLGEIADSFEKSAIAGAFRRMTIAELAQAARTESETQVRATPQREETEETPPTRRRFDTRTDAGRLALTNSIAAFLHNHDGCKAEDVRTKIDASPAQIRQALNRMIEKGIVAKEGQRRATRYYWRGRG